MPGQLTLGWRLATAATWILVFVAWSGVWKASRELGIATWWLGPVGEPRPFPVLLLPFVAPGVMVALALNNARRLPWYGLAAAAICIAIGIVDLGYVRRLGARRDRCSAACRRGGVGRQPQRPVPRGRRRLSRASSSEPVTPHRPPRTSTPLGRFRRP